MSKLRLGGGVREQRQLRVAVRIDEARRDHKPRRIYPPTGTVPGYVTYCSDPAVFHRDVCEIRGLTETIDHGSAADKRVIHLARPPKFESCRAVHASEPRTECGSSWSRSASPKTFRARTAATMAKPGKSENQGAVGR